jgi:predicted phage terminase large subunit-like protein
MCDTVQSFLDGKLLTDSGVQAQILCISMPPQHGKALPTHTPVLTPNGWAKHGDLRVGDRVLGADGLFKAVLAVQRPYMHPCVELSLDTGESFICAPEHEWVVECARDRDRSQRGLRTTEILEAQHIFDGYHAKSPAIQVAKPLLGADSNLPIDPYTLGVWLGDGTSAGTQVTMHKDDADDMLIHIPYEYTKGVHSGADAYNVYIKGLQKGINALGLRYNKHIPAAYLTASLADRLALFMGLMDTDGTVSKDGCICEFCGVNRVLVEGVFTLARSLGIKCSLKQGDAALNGRYISAKYRVQFTPSKGQPLFHIQRKQDRVEAKAKPDRIDKTRFFIKSVTPSEAQEVSCIAVEDGVYLVGGGLVPTHNSMSLTETLPSWYLGNYPRNRVIEVSYNDDFAHKFGRRNREKVSQFGPGLFGIQVSKKTSAVDEWELTNGIGSMLSRGLGGSITGNPADLLIIDDPVKDRQEAESLVFRERVWDAWLNSIRTRLSANGKTVVIMTRWHEDDFVARLQQYEQGVVTINLPCEAEEDDPVYRAVGEPLGLILGKDREWLGRFKQVYLTTEGSRVWQALYQGHPTAAEGALIKRQWWQYYSEMPSHFDEIIQSWDCAFKDGEDNDFVVGTVWGRVAACYYLLDLQRDHLDLPSTIRSIEVMHAKWPRGMVKLVEDKANGPAVIQMLQFKVPGLVPVTPEGGKEARVQAILGAIESGNVYLPDANLAPWVVPFVDECSSFPMGLHDDMVDSMSQALNRLVYHSSHTDPNNPEGRVYTDHSLDAKVRRMNDELIRNRSGRKGGARQI